MANKKLPQSKLRDRFLNVLVDKDTEFRIAQVSRQEKRTKSTMAYILIKEALEMRQ